jgi:hypothetical protein
MELTDKEIQNFTNTVENASREKLEEMFKTTSEYQHKKALKEPFNKTVDIKNKTNEELINICKKSLTENFWVALDFIEKNFDVNEVQINVECSHCDKVTLGIVNINYNKITCHECGRKLN